MCDHGREEVNTRVLSMFFGVAKFESRLVLFLFARKSINHAGFRGFSYAPKVLDLSLSLGCAGAHIQTVVEPEEATIGVICEYKGNGTLINETWFMMKG